MLHAYYSTIYSTVPGQYMHAIVVYTHIQSLPN